MTEPFAWDPARYLAFADERGRPFVELVARIGAESPRTVVDLGCGAGNLTVLLAQRWPGARVVGVDSSAEMVRAAPSPTRPGMAASIMQLLTSVKAPSSV